MGMAESYKTLPIIGERRKETKDFAGFTPRGLVKEKARPGMDVPGCAFEESQEVGFSIWPSWICYIVPFTTSAASM